MSELCAALHDMANEGLDGFPGRRFHGRDRIVVEAGSHLLGLLSAHDAEIRERAKQEQMEADINAIVELGRHRKDMAAVVDTLIQAINAIRAAYAKVRPKREKKEA